MCFLLIQCDVTPVAKFLLCFLCMASAYLTATKRVLIPKCMLAGTPNVDIFIDSEFPCPLWWNHLEIQISLIWVCLWRERRVMFAEEEEFGLHDCQFEGDKYLVNFKRLIHSAFEFHLSGNNVKLRGYFFLWQLIIITRARDGLAELLLERAPTFCDDQSTFEEGGKSIYCNKWAKTKYKRRGNFKIYIREPSSENRYRIIFQFFLNSTHINWVNASKIRKYVGGGRNIETFKNVKRVLQCDPLLGLWTRKIVYILFRI